MLRLWLCGRSPCAAWSVGLYCLHEQRPFITKPTKVLSEPCETVSRHTARQLLFPWVFLVLSMVPPNTKLREASLSNDPGLGYEQHPPPKELKVCRLLARNRVLTPFLIGYGYLLRVAQLAFFYMEHF